MKSQLSQYDYLKPQRGFRFINENELQQALNRVRRERNKMREQELWSEYCSRELQKMSFDEKNSSSSNSMKKTSGLSVDNNNLMKILCNDSHWNTKHLNGNTEDTNNRTERKLSLQKEPTLSYSNMTAISLPCPDVESEIESKIKDTEERINFTCSKILNIIEVIESNLNNFHEPDTPAEIAQFHRKASEFCIRFSRNHFYQIESQFNQLIDVNDKEVATKRETFIYVQKVLKLFQTLLLGYYTFYRHMYIVWGYNGIADKLNGLLSITKKILNSSAVRRGMKEIILANDLKMIIERIEEFMRGIVEGKCTIWHAPTKKSLDSRRIKSANGSVYAASLTKSNTASKSQNPSTVKKRIRSAATTISSDPYYMYQNKQTPTKLYNCRFCHPNRTKNDDVNVFKRLSTNPYKTKLMLAKQNVSPAIKSNNKENKKDFHSLRVRINTENEKMLKKNHPEINNEKFHVVKHDDNAKKPQSSQCQKKNLETLVDNLMKDRDNEVLLKKIIPLIADHFKDIYENVKSASSGMIPKNAENKTKHVAGDKKTKSKNKPKSKENTKLVIVDSTKTNEEFHRRSPDSPSHYFHDSIVKKLLEEIKDDHQPSDQKLKAPDARKKEKERVSQIKKISEDVIKDELSTITMEMDTPLKRFIKRELRDFSDFMYKVHSIGKQ